MPPRPARPARLVSPNQGPICSSCLKRRLASERRGLPVWCARLVELAGPASPWRGGASLPPLWSRPTTATRTTGPDSSRALGRVGRSGAERGCRPGQRGGADRAGPTAGPRLAPARRAQRPLSKDTVWGDCHEPGPARPLRVTASFESGPRNVATGHLVGEAVAESTHEAVADGTGRTDRRSTVVGCGAAAEGSRAVLGTPGLGHLRPPAAWPAVAAGPEVGVRPLRGLRHGLRRQCVHTWWPLRPPTASCPARSVAAACLPAARLPPGTSTQWHAVPR